MQNIVWLVLLSYWTYRNPEYYERISDPIDLSIIEHNIVSNHYKDVETFNNDVQRVFKNAEVGYFSLSVGFGRFSS